MSDVQEAISEAIDHARNSIPERVKSLIRLAKYDLHAGPVFVDETGLNDGSMGEEGHTRFNFTNACTEIRDWADTIQDASVDVGYDEETEEFIYEPIDGSATLIVREILGDLYSYV